MSTVGKALRATLSDLGSLALLVAAFAAIVGPLVLAVVLDGPAWLVVPCLAWLFFAAFFITNYMIEKDHR